MGLPPLSSKLFYIHRGRPDYEGRPLFHQSCFTSIEAVQTIGAAPSFIKAVLHPHRPYSLLGLPPLSSKLFYIHTGHTVCWGCPLFHQSCFTSTQAIQSIGDAPPFIKAVLHPHRPYSLLGMPPLSSKLFHIHTGHTVYWGCPLFHQSCFTSTQAIQSIGDAPSFIKAVSHPHRPYSLLGMPPLSSKLFHIHTGHTVYWGCPLFHQSCFTSTQAIQSIGDAPSFIKAVSHPHRPYSLLGMPPLSSKLFHIHTGHTVYWGCPLFHQSCFTSTQAIQSIGDAPSFIKAVSHPHRPYSLLGMPPLSSKLFHIHTGHTVYWGCPLFHQSCFTSTQAIQSIGAAPSFIKAVLHPHRPYSLLGLPPLSSKLFYIHRGHTVYWGCPLFHQSCFTSTQAIQTMRAACTDA